MAVINISSKSLFQSTIAKGYVLVDFYTTWCGPCKMLSPIIDEISKEINDVSFAKLDIEQVSDVAQQFNVQSIPTVCLFYNGGLINRFVGFNPKERIIQFIRQNKK